MFQLKGALGSEPRPTREGKIGGSFPIKPAAISSGLAMASLAAVQPSSQPTGSLLTEGEQHITHHNLGLIQVKLI